MSSHRWAPDVRNNRPVLRCGNVGCRIVWWPDRQQPLSACRGTPYEETAAETVRALIVGGGA